MVVCVAGSGWCAQQHRAMYQHQSDATRAGRQPGTHTHTCRAHSQASDMCLLNHAWATPFVNNSVQNPCVSPLENNRPPSARIPRTICTSTQPQSNQSQPALNLAAGPSWGC